MLRPGQHTNTFGLRCMGRTGLRRCVPLLSTVASLPLYGQREQSLFFSHDRINQSDGQTTSPPDFSSLKARLRDPEPFTPDVGNKKETDIFIDTSELHKRQDHPHPNPTSPLAKHLVDLIRLRGPISVATFMREALRNPSFGYYVTRNVLGRTGDFVTSPEISQVFGELIGIWICDTWEKLGRPQDLNIIELGPGKGTLMSDILRVLKTVRQFKQCNARVHLVEVSPVLRSAQASLLGCDPKQVTNLWETPSSPCLKGVHGITFQWHNEFSHVPKESFCVIAHEFFDALAIHQFQYTENGWRELLVDIHDGDEMFRPVLATAPTPASTILTARPDIFPQNITPPPVGRIVEVCAEGLAVIEQICSRMASHEGAALVIDYGSDCPSGRSTLRAIREHKLQSIFKDVGDADLSADVNFAALKQASSAMPGVRCHGPISQRAFLKGMEIDVRMARLLVGQHNNAEQSYNLCKSYERLVDPEPNMGLAYQVVALSPSSLPPPVPFGQT